MHTPLFAFLHTQALVRAVKRHGVARRVIARHGHLGTGVTPGDQPLRVHARAADRTVAHEPFSDVPVDLLAQPVARRHEPGLLAFFLWQHQPAGGRRPRQVVRLRLRDAPAEFLERGLHFAGEARPDRFLQFLVPLPHDLVHPRGRHARALKLGKGFSRVHRIELFFIPDQHHARDPQYARDAQQVPRLHGGGERRLVHHKDRFGERLTHVPGALFRQPSLGHAGVAGQEPLQGFALHPRVPSVLAAEADGASPIIR